MRSNKAMDANDGDIMVRPTSGAAPGPRTSAALRTVRRRAALLSLGLVALFAQTGAHAQIPDAVPLPFSRGYLITGGYVVGGVNLAPTSGGGGFLTGTINMAGAN